jgi:protein tyrosine phosphatase (PTP) superfamily phosphohydrolase (DUF442 family)
VLLLYCEGMFAEPPDRHPQTSLAGSKVSVSSEGSESPDVETSREPHQPRLEMTKRECPGLDVVWQISKRIYTGSQPKNDRAFLHLRELGVKTIVSVDGAQPNVKSARAAGLRYVHIPIGYDGVPAEAGAALARLVRIAEGPFYIHCHHGHHRGPAAAAVAAIADGCADNQSALRIMETAGTSPNYGGLWRDVAGYRSPADDDGIPQLVEVAEVESLTAAMARIDRIADHLKMCRTAKWSTPADHPDIVPRQEALLLKESFREAARNLTSNHDQQLRAWLRQSEATATMLEDALAAELQEEATSILELVIKDCKRCHEKHRN